MAKFRRKLSTRSRAGVDQVDALIASLHDGLTSHEITLVRRGAGNLARVGEINWHPGQDTLTCQVNTDEGTYNVTFEQSPDCREILSVYCDCPVSNRDALCEHTYAAMRRFEERLHLTRDPLRERLFGVDDEEAWQVALEEIDEFVQVRSEATSDDSEVTNRLVWRLELKPKKNKLQLEFTPWEQEFSKKNSQWTKGRKVAWDRLAKSPELWTFPGDRDIAAQLEQHMGRSGELPPNFQPPVLELLVHLVANPLVFRADSSDTPVEVRAASLGLAVEIYEGVLELYPAIDNRRVENESAFLILEQGDLKRIVYVEEETNCVLVAAADEATLDLVLNIWKYEPKLPKKVQNDFLARLPKVETVLPVALPPELLGDRVEPDLRTVIRLLPQQPTGLAAEVRVRPAPGGPLLEPGQGTSELSVVVEGRRVGVFRNLELEAARARRIVDDLGLSRQPEIRPWRWLVTTDEESLDLIAAAQQASEEDLVVIWPEGGEQRISREVLPNQLKVEIRDQRDWFGIYGTVEVDGEQIPLTVLLSGLRDGGRYVRLDGDRWLQLSNALRLRLSALDDVLHADRQNLKIDASAAPVLDEIFADECELISSEKWKETIHQFHYAGDLDPAPPTTLTAELRDYQLDGYRWLKRMAAWGMGCCLADDMGLGKTIQTLAMLIDRREVGPTLVVAPTSVGLNWEREIERFAPTLRPILFREADRDQLLAEAAPGDVIIISYGLMQREADRLAAVDWGTLVLDEAQKIKNAQTKTAKASREISAQWRLALTGTPVENHLGELWSIFRAVCPGLFGTWERFKERFAEPIEKKKDPAKRKALSRLVRPFILRRTKSEVLDELPERTEIRLLAELSDREKRRYEEARLAAVAHLTGLDGAPKKQDKRFAVLASLTRLRQLACHPRLVDDGWKESSAKLDLLMDIVEELKDGRHRALIFSQFVQHLQLIREALDARGVSYRYLDGSTPVDKRMEEVDAFQRGEGDLFLISLKAGGTGLNLTAADYVIHMDPWWNPAVEDQATDRAHRIGQTRPVTVYRLVAKDTIEDQILALHADKRDLVAGVLEGTDQADKLSTDDLLTLIMGN